MYRVSLMRLWEHTLLIFLLFEKTNNLNTAFSLPLFVLRNASSARNSKARKEKQHFEARRLRGKFGTLRHYYKWFSKKKKRKEKNLTATFYFIFIIFSFEKNYRSLRIGVSISTIAVHNTLIRIAHALT